MVTTVAGTDACHLDLASANSWSGFSTWWQARTPSTRGAQAGARLVPGEPSRARTLRPAGRSGSSLRLEGWFSWRVGETHGTT
jgi:hypothetical protein